MKFLTTIFLVFLGFYSFAQFSFDRYELNETLDGIESVHSVDFDNDGDMDIFTASGNDNRVILFEQQSDGSFATKVLSNDATGAKVVKSYDFDLDGDLDIVAIGSDPGDHSIWWWENINNTFSNKKVIVNISNQAFQDFQISDLDNDGDLDIVTVEFSTASGPGLLSMWVNDNFNFTLLELSDNCIDGRQIEIVDWDNDNDLDFLISEGLGDKMTFWENKGSLNYEKKTLFYCDVCNSFDIADLDNDGDNDIVALSYLSHTISYWLNDGNNNLTKTIIENQIKYPDKLIIHDIDQDKDLDVIVAYYFSNNLVILENNGDLEFTTSIIDNDFAGGRDICIADLDNDNSLDIVGASLNSKQAIVWINNQVYTSNKEVEVTKSLVYPNPTSGVINIDVDDQKVQSISVKNSRGECMITVPYSDHLDLSNLMNGMYFIQLNLENTIETHKVIIQKSNR